MRNLFLVSLALTLSACRSGALDPGVDYDIGGPRGEPDASAASAFDASVTDLAASSFADFAIQTDRDGGAETQDSGPSSWTASFDDWFGSVVDAAGNPTTDYTGYPDPLTVYDGVDAYELMSTTAGPNDCGAQYEQIGSVGPWLGKRVRMTEAMQTSLTAGSFAALEFYVKGQGTQEIGDDMRNRRITGTTGFTSYSLVLDVESNADSIGFAISMCGTGKVWVGPPSFEQVDDSVPTTQTFSNP